MTFAVTRKGYFEAVRDQVRGLLQNNGAEPTALISSLRRLVQVFTAPAGDRARSPLSEDPLLAAYLMYYGTRAFWLGRLFAERYALDGRAVLDLGSGPGSAGLALLRDRDSRLTLVDPSTAALALGESLTRRLGLGTPYTRVSDAQHLSLGANRYTCIVISNSLNEWPLSVADKADLVDSLQKHLLPGGRLLIVEPARRHLARELSELRDLLLQRGWSLLGPCTHTGACPMLRRRRDFCHGQQQLVLPNEVRDLANRAGGLDVEDADFASLVLAREAQPLLSGYRCVGEPRREKGRTRWFVCGKAGLVELMALNKHRLALASELLDLRRGDLLHLDPEPTSSVSPLRLDRLDRVEKRGWLP